MATVSFIIEDCVSTKQQCAPDADQGRKCLQTVTYPTHNFIHAIDNLIIGNTFLNFNASIKLSQSGNSESFKGLQRKTESTTGTDSR
ncbi:MAG: hypothetical protein CMD99_09515 [Gammaproteobacteria bacterium]|nr:hypothetical protein [Gammaproteobacteria bacterium]